MPPEPLNYRSSDQDHGPSRCSACGSDHTVKGKLAGEVAFKPLKLRKLFSVSGTLRVDAIACAACGAVSLCIDREKLVDLAGEP
jgi:hypothetical protein